MNTHGTPLFRVFGAALLLAAPAAHAQIISEDFSSNPADPNTVSWYYAAGPVTTFTASTGALQFEQGASTPTTNNVSVFRQFTQTSLAVGEALQLSFIYTAFDSQGAANNQLRIGLFDTSDVFAANQSEAPWSSPNEGYIMGIAFGSTITNTSNFFYRSNATNIVSVSAGSTALGTADVLQVLSTPVPVTVNFSITRLSPTEMRLNGSFTQNSVTTLLTTDTVIAAGQYVDTFDTLFIGHGNGSNGRGFTIDDVNLAVVPEPSSYALLVGVGFGVMAAVRRFRPFGRARG